MSFYRYNGFLNIYKEKGWTSMDVCAKLKGILGVRRIGHAGTLDPMAEGVLPVAVGRATKDVDKVGHEVKVYKAGMLLGAVTDTEDITGKLLSIFGQDFCKSDEILQSESKDDNAANSNADFANSSSGVKAITEQAYAIEKNGRKAPDEATVKEAILSFIGEYDQLTPKYSARKVNGKKLYEYARAGVEVERKRKHVHIYDISIESIELPHVVFTVKCSQGTYIRTLCHDIGEKLQCGACMESLVREQVGRFKIDDSIKLSKVEEFRDKGSLDASFTIEAPTAISIGKFDGTHVGHQTLLKDLKRLADKKGLRTCVIIFKFGKETVLSDLDRKMKMAELGIDYSIELEFTDEIKNTTAEDFLKNILIDKYNMKAIVAGDDVSFGKGRAGNAEFLKAHADEYSYEVKLIEKVTIDLKQTADDAGCIESKEPSEKTSSNIEGKATIISSTLLRAELLKGDMLHVTRLLGAPYAISGVVIHGKHIGTDKLAMPTLNIAVPEDLILPPNGVYAVRVNIYDDKKGSSIRTKTGIANLGYAPTVNEDGAERTGLRLETHVFGDIGDCYGKFARIELCYFIRHERKFDDLADLKRQVAEHDIPETEKFFAGLIG